MFVALFIFLKSLFSCVGVSWLGPCLFVVRSLCWGHGLSRCGTWAPRHGGWVLAVVQQIALPSFFLTRDQTLDPCFITGQILNDWTARVPTYLVSDERWKSLSTLNSNTSVSHKEEGETTFFQIKRNQELVLECYTNKKLWTKDK